MCERSHTIVDHCREIVKEHAYREIDGVIVDATTANIVVQVWEALSPENQKRLADIAGNDVVTFTGICMKLGFKGKRTG